MSSQFMILCVDDEREVLDSVVQDLASFEEAFVIEAAESVKEAREVIDDYREQGVKLALIICDHIMPEQTGISFLIELSENPETVKTRKLLLTGQAGLEDTVQAVTHSCLNYFFSKPWSGDQLRHVVREQLTQFMIDTETDLMPWIQILDPEKLLMAIAEKRISYGE